RTAAQRLAFLRRPAYSGYGTTRLPPWAHHASVEARRLPGPRGPALLYGAGAVARAPGRARGGCTCGRVRERGGRVPRETLRPLPRRQEARGGVEPQRLPRRGGPPQEPQGAPARRTHDRSGG